MLLCRKTKKWNLVSEKFIEKSVVVIRLVIENTKKKIVKVN